MHYRDTIVWEKAMAIAAPAPRGAGRDCCCHSTPATFAMNFRRGAARVVGARRLPLRGGRSVLVFDPPPQGTRPQGLGKGRVGTAGRGDGAGNPPKTQSPHRCHAADACWCRQSAGSPARRHRGRNTPGSPIRFDVRERGRSPIRGRRTTPNSLLAGNAPLCPGQVLERFG